VSTRLPFRLLLAGLIASLAGTLVLPSAGVAHEVDRPAVASNPEQAQAEETLALAKALFAGARSDSGRRGSAGVPGRDATMVLRDLARQADGLPTARQRAIAARLLARPTMDDGVSGNYPGDPEYVTDDGSFCGAHVCVHWVEDTSVHAVQGADNDGDISTVPPWVRTALATMESVYAKEVTTLGYRPPLPDGTLGGNSKLDVYLADLGVGFYGYCAADDESNPESRTAFGYCVLDNDYSPSQFPTNTPLQNLRVTAAHELFHMVQYAYDWSEDVWFMEGTAAWIEDEVYDGVNDNVQYLAESPLTYPYVPLDLWADGLFNPYGNWVFWRFLSESTGPGSTDNPGVVRRVWNAAADSTYSTQALKQVLIARGSNFPRTFSRFGTWARDPARYFSEGRYQKYPRAPLDKSFTLTRTRRTTGGWNAPLDHMTHSYFKITPGGTLTGRWRLRINVNMASATRGSVARIVVHKRSGGVSAYGIRLNSAGNGDRVFGFRRAFVKDIELDLVNASTRFRCGQGTTLSCGGAAYDDRLTARFRATAIR
jgi:hypothetical protein